MDPAPIISLFNQLLTLGATVAGIVTAFFVMLAGYQYMTAGGSVRAIESAKGSLYHAFIGFAVVILAKALANLVGAALGAPAAAAPALPVAAVVAAMDGPLASKYLNASSNLMALVPAVV